MPDLLTRQQRDEIAATWKPLLDARQTDNSGLPVHTDRGAEVLRTIRAADRDLEAIPQLLAHIEAQEKAMQEAMELLGRTSLRIPPDPANRAYDLLRAALGAGTEAKHG